MRSLILSFPARLQAAFVTVATILMAFGTAMIFSMLFDAHQLKANTDLISSVYQVMGTIYAILLTFTLWGVWQRYTDADTAVQTEAFALLDLVHMVEASPRWASYNVRGAALAYTEGVVKQEWVTLKDITSAVINIREQGHSSCNRIINVVQSIAPNDERETAIFAQTLKLLDDWMDARRKRILIARGNSVQSLWPLLLTGAFVLFAFHGLFVAQTPGIWITMLAGTSLVIGLTFYLIFTLDCPFAGSPCIDSEPFYLATGLLKKKLVAVSA